MLRNLVIAAFLSAAACDPFSIIATNQEIMVPDSEVPKIELLVPGRHLPPSARQVRMHLLHFQDTSLRVRFEAEQAEARTFARELLGQELGEIECGEMVGPDQLSWWISRADLQRAECGRDTRVDGDGLPYAEIAMIRSENVATVWLHTFGP